MPVNEESSRHRLALLPAAGCVHRIPPLTPGAPVRFSVDLPFDNHVLELHLSRPCVIDAAHPLVLFATGDGGWRGKDKDAFEHLTEWGYPLAGFSAPSYLPHITRHTHATTPADVARDYARIIGVAKERLGLPAETPTILLGVSRGSGLAVAAAGEPDLLPAARRRRRRRADARGGVRAAAEAAAQRAARRSGDGHAG